MANYMAEVAKMLGVEFDEEFEIEFPSPSSVKATAVFSENGFRIINTDAYILTPYWAESVFHNLLKGSLTIKRKPWKPKDNELFFVVSFDGKVMFKYWDEESTPYRTYYKIGNCYRYKDEAEANRDKWMAFYASDEISDGKMKCVDRALGWMHGAGDIVGTVNDVYCLNKAIKNKLPCQVATSK